MKYTTDKYNMKEKKTYHSPEQWEEAVGVLLMTLPDSQGEITDDPATEPAMLPGATTRPRPEMVSGATYGWHRRQVLVDDICRRRRSHGCGTDTDHRPRRHGTLLRPQRTSVAGTSRPRHLHQERT